ncbi:helix-turn-helix domain-containing protein [uncultured Jatrophihabitans sp.]|uniref:helix-turn-helix domain-containing protein n=1 Tax=uncultured Jatrophihabitans sp. TaxID=1610747 RepID=UPI0035CAEE85
MNHDGDYTDEQMLLTIVQAARLLGIGRTTVYQLIKDGELHPVHVARACRLSWAELERYVARLDAANQPDLPPATSKAARRWRRVTDASGRALFAVDISKPGGDSAA